ncbi:MAG: hypothetical protein HYZ29_25125 [Myxococcales bacterium]|nr:hypothetical protein [Myxococcales bacterium]
MKQRDLRAQMTLAGSAALLVSATAAGAGPTLLPNTQPYRVKTPSAATGRSGNARLATRALLAKDGKTVFDVTTGELDSGASAPGNIAKVQFKTFDGLGEVAWAKNYPSLTGGGSVAYTFDELHRGQPVQTQANVTGIDGKRTDVVTVTGNVKLRPDLVARGLDSPKQATVGAPVNIAATVLETNGDVGARANCVLFVDGAEIDRADGIYVDGGSAVSCAFTPSFSAVGTHALEVRVTDVVPADWDTTNNSVTGSIQIASNDVPFYWSASAASYQYSSSGMSAGWYRVDDGTYRSEMDWTSVWDNKGWHQSSYLSGQRPAALSFPLTQVSIKHLADDALVGSFELADVTPDSSWGSGDYTENRVYRFDPTTYTIVYIVSYSHGGAGQAIAFTHKYAGDVTYFSSNYQKSWNSYDGIYYYYSRNNAGHSVFGEAWPMTSSAHISLDVADAKGASISADASIAVAAYSDGDDYPYQCQTQSWSWGAQQNCYESHYSESGVRGSASGVN